MEKKDNTYHTVKRWIDARVDAHARKRSEQFVEEYARKPDGTQDENLAYRIRWEVARRSEMGKVLDIYEPLRWAAIQTLLAIPVGGLIKYITDRKDRKFTLPALAVLAASTLLNNAIQLVRIFPRYDMGLRGGAETAVKLEHDFKAPSNDQAGLQHKRQQQAQQKLNADAVSAPATGKEWGDSVSRERAVAASEQGRQL